MSEQTVSLLRALSFGAVLGLGLLLERRAPHARLSPAWRTNLGLWLIDTLVMTAVCGACGWLVAGWAAERGLGLLNVLAAPAWAGMLVGLLGLDAVSYLWHRANHRVTPLWRFHRVHHADASFHVTTALRFHPGELLLSLPVRLTAIVVLGVSPLGVVLFELVFGTANLLEHGNFDLPRRAEGAFQRCLVTPALHRRHHAPDWRCLNSNFGTIFTLWDRLGGSFAPSQAAATQATGLPGRGAVNGVLASLRLPFVPRRELR